MAINALTSEWGLLSDHLIAEFWEVDRLGKRVDPDTTVRAPLTEGSLDMTQNWQNPFETVGQSNLPTLQQLLQSGAGTPLVQKIDGALGTDIQKLSSNLEGKSSITKLNSMQIWSGSPPAKFQITAVFRAWKDAIKEVEKPVDQLAQWHLPKYLADDGFFLSRLADKGADSSTALPSAVPSIIAFKYKGRTYSPVVIESLGLPIVSPITADGAYAELLITMTLATLTSIDMRDWKAYSGG